MKPWLQRSLRGLRYLALLLSLIYFAVGIRLLYQNVSVVNNPLRADAYQYYKMATSRWLEQTGRPPLPSEVQPPMRFQLSAGYPVFVAWCFDESDRSHMQRLARVLRVQAGLGGITAGLTFVMGSLFLPLTPAFLAGLLVAINPHLIAVDGYLLTESLFTLLSVAGVLSFALSWKWRSLLMGVLGTVLLLAGASLRPLNIFLFLLLWIPMLANYRRKRSSISRGIHAAVGRSTTVQRRSFGMRRGVVIAGCLVLVAAVIFAVLTQKSARSAGSGGASVLTRVFIDAAWISIVQGSYPGYYAPGQARWDRAGWRLDATYRTIIRDPGAGLSILAQRIRTEPLDYIKWYGGGKIIFTWGWDNIYNGDVYIYPMHKKGFEIHPVLNRMHRFSRAIHYYVLAGAMLLPFLLWAAGRFGLLSPPVRYAFAPMIALFYGLLMLTILSPLPRYSIPLRPFGILCFMASVYHCFQLGRLAIYRFAGRSEP